MGDLLNINCGIAKGTVEACARYCPNAVLGLIVNPVNSVVPAMCELWKKAGLDPRKIIGISTLDVVRANKFVQELTGMPANIPVIGGHAGKTILPLFSQDPAGASIPPEMIPDLDVRVQDAGTEVVKAKNGKGSATLSMAYAGARLAKSVLKGLSGVPEVLECAYVESNVIEGLPYFASYVVLGPNGVDAVLPIGDLTPHEEARLAELAPILQGEIQDGLDYAANPDNEFAGQVKKAAMTTTTVKWTGCQGLPVECMDTTDGVDFDDDPVLARLRARLRKRAQDSAAEEQAVQHCQSCVEQQKT